MTTEFWGWLWVNAILIVGTGSWIVVRSVIWLIDRHEVNKLIAAGRSTFYCRHRIHRTIKCEKCFAELKAEFDAAEEANKQPAPGIREHPLMPGPIRWIPDDQVVYPDSEITTMFTIPARPGQLVVVIDHRDYGRGIKESSTIVGALQTVYRAKLHAEVYHVPEPGQRVSPPKDLSRYCEVDENIAIICAQGDLRKFRMKELRNDAEILGKSLLEELIRRS